jgi:hypothetical protein
MNFMTSPTEKLTVCASFIELGVFETCHYLTSPSLCAVISINLYHLGYLCKTKESALSKHELVHFEHILGTVMSPDLKNNLTEYSISTRIEVLSTNLPLSVDPVQEWDKSMNQ